jgi:hypothetical protein
MRRSKQRAYDDGERLARPFGSARDKLRASGNQRMGGAVRFADSAWRRSPAATSANPFSYPLSESRGRPPTCRGAALGSRFWVLGSGPKQPQYSIGGIWGIGAAGAAGISVTSDSVVSTSAAMEAAFSSAERVTFTGSMIPRSNMFPNTPSWAS